MTSESRDEAIQAAMLARFWKPGSAARMPVMDFVAGQMGSGKTTIAKALADQVPHGEGHMTIDGDAIAQMHPNYHRVESIHGTARAQAHTLAFASEWQGRLLAHAQAHGHHVTREVAPAHIDIRQLAFEAEMAGFATRLTMVAVPEHESRQALKRREANESAERGSARTVSVETHDHTYAAWTGSLASLHADHAVGEIRVVANPRSIGRTSLPPAPQVLSSCTRTYEGARPRWDAKGTDPVSALIAERIRAVGPAERFAHSRRWDDLAKSGYEVAALRADDARRLSAPQDGRLLRELRLAGNADAAAEPSGVPSRTLTTRLSAAQALLSAPAPRRRVAGQAR